MIGFECVTQSLNILLRVDTASGGTADDWKQGVALAADLGDPLSKDLQSVVLPAMQSNSSTISSVHSETR